MGFLDDLVNSIGRGTGQALDYVTPGDQRRMYMSKQQVQKQDAQKKKPQPRPYLRPVDGQMIVEEVGKATNTVGNAIGKFAFEGTGKLANSGFGIVENTGANVLGEFQKAMGDKAKGEKTIRDMKASVDARLLGEGKGLFGAGGIYKSTDEMHNADPIDALKRAGGTGLQSLSETLPIKAGTAVLKGASPAFNKIMQGTGIGLGQGAAYSTGSQLSNTGKVQGDQLALDTATGGLIGGAIPGGIEVTKVVAPAIKKQAQIAARKSEENLLRQAAKDKILTRVEPHYIQPSGKQLDQGIVSQKRAEIINGNIDPIIVTQNKEGFMKVLDGEHRLQAYLELGVPQVPTRVVTPGEVKMMKQGGYAQVPYNPSKRVKQAENDFIAGKISSNQLEKIRVADTKAPASPQKATLPVQSQTPSTKLFPKTSDVSSTSKLNTNRISLTDEAKNRLDVDTNEVIGRLSNKEVQQFAKAAGMQTKGVTIDGTKKKIAEQLNLRNEIYSVEQQIAAAKKAGNTDEALALMKKSAELGRTSRSQGTDLGRQLAARRIIADVMATPQQKLFRLFDEAGVDADTYTKRLADVDMNNADEVMKAYRDLVPAKFSDWLDKYRYTNMLSSPLTHIVNIASNTQGLLGIAPVEKAFAGAVDATRAAIKGGPRTRFASESGAYTKASIKSAPQAMKTFADIMTGKKLMEMPDADALKQGRLATSGIAGVADNILSIVPKFLEATDQATMTMARAGEKAALNKRISKGVEVSGDIDGKVTDAATYRVFRQDLSKEGEGYVLNFMDGLPEIIKGARNSKSKGVATIAKFTFPFVQTIANIAKQGVEYSPVGITTLAGNADKTGQLAKVAMGTTVTALVAASFAAKDGITFSEPSDAKSRDAFRAEGKQPYAVKIGDKWVNYSKLHPAIAFNFAIVGAVKDAQDKNAIDQPTADKIMNMAGSVMGYFRDQSFMKGVGDFTSALEVKDGASYEDAIATIGSNWGNQLVPFKSMVSWIGRQIDPTQRKTDYGADMLEQIRQNMVKDIPGLNSNVPVRENPYYKDQSIPITNDNPLLNSFSPNRITNDRGYGNTTGLNVTQRREMSQLPDADKPAFRQAAIDEKFKKKQETEIAKKNGTTKTGKKTEIAKGLDKSYADTLKEFDALDTPTREKKFYKENAAEFRYEAAKYENKKASGTLTQAETIRAEDKLAKLEAGSKFSKETRDLYGLSKKQLTALIDEGKVNEKQAEQILAYGDALKGIDGYNKFKDKNGNVAIRPKAKGSGGGRKKGTGKGKAGGKKQLPSDSNSSTIALVSNLSRKVANTKVAKRAIPSGGGVRAPGIKAYKKVAKTNVSMTRKA